MAETLDVTTAMVNGGWEKRPRVSRLKRLIRAIHPRSLERNAERLDSLVESTRALRREMHGIQETLTRVKARMEAMQLRTEQLATLHRKSADERVRLGGMAGGKLLSHSIVLDSRLRLRSRTRRVPVGDPVEIPFAESMGVARCAEVSPDVRALWERLVACETAGPDSVLRGSPSTILDVGPAVVSRGEGRTVSVSLLERSMNDRHAADNGSNVTALPRFTSDFSRKKLRNVGHWLLDCLPQVVALCAVAPDAVLLLPDHLTSVHKAMLELVGVAPNQIQPWDGAPTECSRLLLFESNGSAGGGRPLSGLIEMCRIFRRSFPFDERRHRRIYVSRRDARANRRWVSNERDVEALFESRGFEILVMADSSVVNQVRAFRNARIVAGPSGGGLADIVFSPPGTHVVVLHTEGLVRWYAGQGGARSDWANGGRARGGELAALGDSPRFYAHLAAALSQCCHSFLSGDRIPIDELSGFLDDVLELVEKEEETSLRNLGETLRGPIEKAH